MNELKIFRFLPNIFMEHICHEYGMPLKRIDDSAIEELQKIQLDWKYSRTKKCRWTIDYIIEAKISRKEVLDYVIPASQRHNKFKELFEQFDSVQELNEFIKKEFNAYNQYNQQVIHRINILLLMNSFVHFLKLWKQKNNGPS